MRYICRGNILITDAIASFTTKEVLHPLETSIEVTALEATTLNSPFFRF